MHLASVLKTATNQQIKSTRWHSVSSSCKGGNFAPLVRRFTFSTEAFVVSPSSPASPDSYSSSSSSPYLFPTTSGSSVNYPCSFASPSLPSFLHRYSSSTRSCSFALLFLLRGVSSFGLCDNCTGTSVRDQQLLLHAALSKSRSVDELLQVSAEYLVATQQRQGRNPLLCSSSSSTVAANELQLQQQTPCAATPQQVGLTPGPVIATTVDATVWEPAAAAPTEEVAAACVAPAVVGANSNPGAACISPSSSVGAAVDSAADPRRAIVDAAGGAQEEDEVLLRLPVAAEEAADFGLVNAAHALLQLAVLQAAGKLVNEEAFAQRGRGNTSEGLEGKRRAALYMEEEQNESRSQLQSVTVLQNNNDAVYTSSECMQQILADELYAHASEARQLQRLVPQKEQPVVNKVQQQQQREELLPRQNLQKQHEDQRKQQQNWGTPEPRELPKVHLEEQEEEMRQQQRQPQFHRKRQQANHYQVKTQLYLTAQQQQQRQRQQEHRQEETQLYLIKQQQQRKGEQKNGKKKSALLREDQRFLALLQCVLHHVKAVHNTAGTACNVVRPSPSVCSSPKFVSDVLSGSKTSSCTDFSHSKANGGSSRKRNAWWSSSSADDGSSRKKSDSRSRRRRDSACTHQDVNNSRSSTCAGTSSGSSSNNSSGSSSNSSSSSSSHSGRRNNSARSTSNCGAESTSNGSAKSSSNNSAKSHSNDSAKSSSDTNNSGTRSSSNSSKSVTGNNNGDTSGKGSSSSSNSSAKGSSNFGSDSRSGSISLSERNGERSSYTSSTFSRREVSTGSRRSGGIGRSASTDDINSSGNRRGANQMPFPISSSKRVLAASSAADHLLPVAARQAANSASAVVTYTHLSMPPWADTAQQSSLQTYASAVSSRPLGRSTVSKSGEQELTGEEEQAREKMQQLKYYQESLQRLQQQQQMKQAQQLAENRQQLHLERRCVRTRLQRAQQLLLETGALWKRRASFQPRREQQQKQKEQDEGPQDLHLQTLHPHNTAEEKEKAAQRLQHMLHDDRCGEEESNIERKEEMAAAALKADKRKNESRGISPPAALQSRLRFLAAVSWACAKLQLHALQHQAPLPEADGAAEGELRRFGRDAHCLLRQLHAGERGGRGETEKVEKAGIEHQLTKLVECQRKGEWKKPHHEAAEEEGEADEQQGRGEAEQQASGMKSQRRQDVAQHKGEVQKQQEQAALKRRERQVAPAVATAAQRQQHQHDDDEEERSGRERTMLTWLANDAREQERNSGRPPRVIQLVFYKRNCFAIEKSLSVVSANLLNSLVRTVRLYLPLFNPRSLSVALWSLAQMQPSFRLPQQQQQQRREDEIRRKTQKKLFSADTEGTCQPRLGTSTSLSCSEFLSLHEGEAHFPSQNPRLPSSPDTSRNLPSSQNSRLLCPSQNSRFLVVNEEKRIASVSREHATLFAPSPSEKRNHPFASSPRYPPSAICNGGRKRIAFQSFPGLVVGDGGGEATTPKRMPREANVSVVEKAADGGITALLQFWEKAAAAAISSLPHMTLREVATIVHAFAAVHFKHEQLLAAAAARATQSLHLLLSKEGCQKASLYEQVPTSSQQKHQQQRHTCKQEERDTAQAQQQQQYYEKQQEQMCPRLSKRRASKLCHFLDGCRCCSKGLQQPLFQVEAQQEKEGKQRRLAEPAKDSNGKEDVVRGQSRKSFFGGGKQNQENAGSLGEAVAVADFSHAEHEKNEKRNQYGFPCIAPREHPYRASPRAHAAAARLRSRKRFQREGEPEEESVGGSVSIILSTLAKFGCFSAPLFSALATLLLRGEQQLLLHASAKSVPATAAAAGDANSAFFPGVLATFSSFCNFSATAPLENYSSSSGRDNAVSSALAAATVTSSKATYKLQNSFSLHSTSPAAWAATSLPVCGSSPSTSSSSAICSPPPPPPFAIFASPVSIPSSSISSFPLASAPISFFSSSAPSSFSFTSASVPSFSPSSPSSFSFAFAQSFSASSSSSSWKASLPPRGCSPRSSVYLPPWRCPLAAVFSRTKDKNGNETPLQDSSLPGGLSHAGSPSDVSGAGAGTKGDSRRGRARRKRSKEALVSCGSVSSPRRLTSYSLPDSNSKSSSESTAAFFLFSSAEALPLRRADMKLKKRIFLSSLRPTEASAMAWAFAHCYFPLSSATSTATSSSSITATAAATHPSSPPEPAPSSPPHFLSAQKSYQHQRLDAGLLKKKQQQLQHRMANHTERPLQHYQCVDSSVSLSQKISAREESQPEKGIALAAAISSARFAKESTGGEEKACIKKFSFQRNASSLPAADSFSSWRPPKKDVLRVCSNSEGCRAEHQQPREQQQVEQGGAHFQKAEQRQGLQYVLQHRQAEKKNITKKRDKEEQVLVQQIEQEWSVSVLGRRGGRPQEEGEEEEGAARILQCLRWNRWSAFFALKALSLHAFFFMREYTLKDKVRLCWALVLQDLYFPLLFTSIVYSLEHRHQQQKLLLPRRTKRMQDEEEEGEKEAQQQYQPNATAAAATASTESGEVRTKETEAREAAAVQEKAVEAQGYKTAAGTASVATAALREGVRLQPVEAAVGDERGEGGQTKWQQLDDAEGLPYSTLGRLPQGQEGAEGRAATITAAGARRRTSAVSGDVLSLTAAVGCRRPDAERQRRAKRFIYIWNATATRRSCSRGAEEGRGGKEEGGKREEREDEGGGGGERGRKREQGTVVNGRGGEVKGGGGGGKRVEAQEVTREDKERPPQGKGRISIQMQQLCSLNPMPVVARTDISSGRTCGEETLVRSVLFTPARGRRDTSCLYLGVNPRSILAGEAAAQEEEKGTTANGEAAEASTAAGSSGDEKVTAAFAATHGNVAAEVVCSSDLQEAAYQEVQVAASTSHNSSSSPRHIGRRRIGSLWEWSKRGSRGRSDRSNTCSGNCESPQRVRCGGRSSETKSSHVIGSERCKNDEIMTADNVGSSNNKRNSRNSIYVQRAKKKKKFTTRREPGPSVKPYRRATGSRTQREQRQSSTSAGKKRSTATAASASSAAAGGQKYVANTHDCAALEQQREAKAGVDTCTTLKEESMFSRGTCVKRSLLTRAEKSRPSKASMQSSRDSSRHPVRSSSSICRDASKVHSQASAACTDPLAAVHSNSVNEVRSQQSKSASTAAEAKANPAAAERRMFVEATSAQYIPAEEDPFEDTSQKPYDSIVLPFQLQTQLYLALLCFATSTVKRCADMRSARAGESDDQGSLPQHASPAHGSGKNRLSLLHEWPYEVEAPDSSQQFPCVSITEEAKLEPHRQERVAGIEDRHGIKVESCSPRGGTEAAAGSMSGGLARDTASEGQLAESRKHAGGAVAADLSAAADALEPRTASAGIVSSAIEHVVRTPQKSSLALGKAAQSTATWCSSDENAFEQGSSIACVTKKEAGGHVARVRTHEEEATPGLETRKRRKRTCSTQPPFPRSQAMQKLLHSCHALLKPLTRLRRLLPVDNGRAHKYDRAKLKQHMQRESQPQLEGELQAHGLTKQEMHLPRCSRGESQRSRLQRWGPHIDLEQLMQLRQHTGVEETPLEHESVQSDTRSIRSGYAQSGEPLHSKERGQSTKVDDKGKALRYVQSKHHRSKSCLQLCESLQANTHMVPEQSKRVNPHISSDTPHQRCQPPSRISPSYPPQHEGCGGETSLLKKAFVRCRASLSIHPSRLEACRASQFHVQVLVVLRRLMQEKATCTQYAFTQRAAADDSRRVYAAPTAFFDVPSGALFTHRPPSDTPAQLADRRKPPANFQTGSPGPLVASSDLSPSALHPMHENFPVLRSDSWPFPFRNFEPRCSSKLSEQLNMRKGGRLLPDGAARGTGHKAANDLEKLPDAKRHRLGSIRIRSDSCYCRESQNTVASSYAVPQRERVMREGRRNVGASNRESLHWLRTWHAQAEYKDPSGLQVDVLLRPR